MLVKNSLINKNKFVLIMLLKQQQKQMNTVNTYLYTCIHVAPWRTRQISFKEILICFSRKTRTEKTKRQGISCIRHRSRLAKMSL